MARQSIASSRGSSPVRAAVRGQPVDQPSSRSGVQPNPVPHAQGAINAQDGQPEPNAQEAQNGQPGNPDDALARAVVPSLPPLNLLATIQASPQGADDDDNDDEHRQARPKHVPQKELTKHIMSRKHEEAPEAPWTRGRQMLALRQAQKIPTIGPEEGPGVTDPSILQSVMPHQVAADEAAADAGAGAGAGDGAAADAGAGAGAGDGADANVNPGAGVGGVGNAPKRHMLTHSPAGCTLAGPMYLTWNQLRLGRSSIRRGSVSNLVWSRRALHGTPGNIAPVADSRLTPITCTPANSTAATGMRPMSTS